MQVKELKSEGLSYELEVTVEAKDIEKHVDSRLAEYGKNVKLPGFRPGKVPLDVLKQRYGRAVMGEVLEHAVNDSTMKALTEKNLRPALQPKIEVTQFDEGKDLTYKMQVEVLPEFEITDLKKIKLEKPVAKPSDKEMEEALERIAKQNQQTEPVKGDRATKKGDIVVIDFHGRTADDNVAHEGMHAHDHQLELGGGQFIPGFEEQLIGQKAGEKVEVKVSFPEEYHAPDLAGRDAIFDVDVKDILVAKPAEINDDFAKKLGLADEKALRDAVKEQMEGEFSQLSRLKVKRFLLDELDNSHDFEIPAGMLEMEFESIRQQIAMERQADLNEEGKLELSKDEEDELQAIAERRVRLGMILSEIGQQNNISVSDQELQRAVISEAQKYPGQEAQVFEYYKSNRQALEALRAPVFEDKVVDFVLELANIQETEVSIDDLMAEDEEEEPYVKGGKKKSGSSSKSSSSKSAKSKSSGSSSSKKSTAKKSDTKTKKTAAKSSTKSGGAKKSSGSTKKKTAKG